jgi:uncharacterized membrane protein
MLPEVRQIWFVVLCVAAVQILVALFAVYSSSQDILSNGACIGGIFGSLVNLVILAIAGIVLLVLGFKSWHAKAAHPALSPVFVLAASSALSIFLGLQAGLRCTV